VLKLKLPGKGEKEKKSEKNTDIDIIFKRLYNLFSGADMNYIYIQDEGICGVVNG
jgi:hypothetical protein